jgi:undecaprenyl-diphosphatase
VISGVSAWLRRLHAKSIDELAPFALLALIAALLAGFVRIAGAISSGNTYAFDEQLLRALRVPNDPMDPIGPAWLELAMRDITSLGSFTVLIILILAAVGYLLIDGKRAAAFFVMAATGGGIILSETLKALFGRPRPDLVAHLVDVQSMSFPSGHAMLSAVTFLTLGALLTREQARARIKVYLITVAIVLTLLVGSSRVYLGVHWPTDVLAGWCAGASWAIACWMLARWLQQRGQIEPPDGK